MSNLKINGQLISDTDYSLNETKTGATWIDNKPIYRKCWSITTPTLTSGTVDSFIIDSSFLPASYNIVKLNAVIRMTGYQVVIPFAYTTIQQIWIDFVSGGLRCAYYFNTAAYASQFSGKTLEVVVEYTKAS